MGKVRRILSLLEGKRTHFVGGQIGLYALMSIIRANLSFSVGIWRKWLRQERIRRGGFGLKVGADSAAEAFGVDGFSGALPTRFRCIGRRDETGAPFCFYAKTHRRQPVVLKPECVFLRKD